MTSRERFLKTLKFENVDRVINLESCLWWQTKKRWETEEFLNPKVLNSTYRLPMLWQGNKYFKLDGILWTEDFIINLPYPWQDDKILWEDDKSFIYIDNIGRKRKATKVGLIEGQHISMDQYLEFPVKDESSFKIMKKKYTGNFKERYPRNIDVLKKYSEINYKPIILGDLTRGYFGYYSMLRNWMGTEGLSYLFYDNPALIHEACEFLTDYIINLSSEIVSQIKFDLCMLHEDFAMKTGPLFSPDIFKKFMYKGYKKVIEFLKSNGVKLVAIDSDGNFEPLIPLCLDIGIDGWSPMEVAAGMDPVLIRKKYGKSFFMIGGVDKREIAKGPEYINREIKKLIPVIKDGGFIPTIDHAIPPDISLANFKYYLKLKKKALDIK